MSTSPRWTMVGLLEDGDMRKDHIPLPRCEELLRYLRAALYTFSTHAAARIVTQYERDLFQFILSDFQAIRLQFFLGRAYLLLERWNDALLAFERCHTLMGDADLVATIHLYRWWGIAAHQAHHYEDATGKYGKLFDATQQLLARGNTRFVREDAYGFLCGIYYNQAFLWLRLGAFETARNLLEWKALPLIRAHFRESQRFLLAPARDQSDMNWRLLRMFIPWLLSTIISWQARLADESYRYAYDQDLADAYESILALAQESQSSVEGRFWTCDLYTVAAELLLLRCDLIDNRQLQGFLCSLARHHLQTAQYFRPVLGSSKAEQLRLLLLDFPIYELEFRELEATDTLIHSGPTIKRLATLRHQIDSEFDPNYRFFAARCSLLLGTMAYARHRIAPAGDATWRTWALNNFNEALDILDQGMDLSSLLEKAILMMQNRLLREFPT